MKKNKTAIAFGLDKKLWNEQRHICREGRKCCNSYFSTWLWCEMSSQLAFLPIASSQPLIIALIKALWGQPLSICFKVLLKAGWRILFNICPKVTSGPTSLAPTSIFLSCWVSLLCYCYRSYLWYIFLATLAPLLQHCRSVWSVNYWIAIYFHTDIRRMWRIIPADFCDSLTFPPAPLWAQHLSSRVEYLAKYPFMLSIHLCESLEDKL